MSTRALVASRRALIDQRLALGPLFAVAEES